MKTVLITGSSRGIGAAAARRFAGEKWNVVINCSRTKDALVEVQKELELQGSQVLVSVGDVSDESYVKALFGQIQERFGGIDVVVNNAGIDTFGLIQDTDVSEWDRLMAVNARSAFLTTKYAVPLFLKNQSGSIVNIASVWGTEGGSCESVYSASKGAIISFTKAAARELAPSGIRVNALAFGAIDTSMNDRLNADEKRALMDEIPLGRMGTPCECADLIYHCAVTFTYLTGQIITMDGGWM